MSGPLRPSAIALLRLEVQMQQAASGLRVHARLLQDRLTGGAFAAPTEMQTWPNIPAAAFGLPSNLSPATLQDQRTFRVPTGFVVALSQALEFMTNPEEPLWLQIRTPRGYLAALPWEETLAAHMPARPILRLPDLLVDPVHTSAGRVHVAVSHALLPPDEPAAAATEAALLQAQIRALLEASVRPVTVHCFAHSITLAALAPLLGDVPGSVDHVRLHAPETYFPESPVVQEEKLQSGWLRWMRHTLRETGVELVHFTGYGMVQQESTGLVLPESAAADPAQTMARTVGAAELQAFLTCVGAVTVLFGAPVDRASEIGLRLLLDQLARIRPGQHAYHSRRLDPDLRALAGGYHLLLSQGRYRVPPSPAVAYFCHPSRVRKPDDPPEPAMSGIRGSAGGGNETLTTLYRDATAAPAWVEAALRHLDNRTLAYAQQDDPAEPGGVRSSSQAAAVEASATLRRLQRIVEDAAREELQATRSAAEETAASEPPADARGDQDEDSAGEVEA